MDEKNEFSQEVGPYKATANLNTAIENPQVNINSAVDVNIQNFPSNVDSNAIQQVDNTYDDTVDKISDVESVSSTVSSEPVVENTFINEDLKNDSVDNVNSNNDEVQYVSTNGMGEVYEPTVAGKKKNSFSVTIPKELKVMFFIVFLLFIFVLAIPGIYDFFKGLGLVVTG